MKNWENYIYGFSGAVLGALGLLFVIIGAGCLLGSFAAIIIALKKRNSLGYKVS
jgi:hydroxyethylthiazole kinase-like sugar kinase family protein